MEIESAAASLSDTDTVGLQCLPLSRSTLHRMVKEKRFPRAHELSPVRIGFFLDEVLAWQQALLDNEFEQSEATCLTATSEASRS